MQNKKKSIIFAIKQKSISNQQNRYKVFYKKTTIFAAEYESSLKDKKLQEYKQYKK